MRSPSILTPREKSSRTATPVFPRIFLVARSEQSTVDKSDHRRDDLFAREARSSKSGSNRPAKPGQRRTEALQPFSLSGVAEGIPIWMVAVL